ncbi:carboxylate--amine ligase [Serpentinicella sp. ANB-PHB4]|uniref:carboxylate--amine ligase n=1 Tax=Serpentinicella sp. ANB-PHB4 TaxID=3074076 RepID=UPI002865A5B5|nr:carboxylate--amine ligase [Serpentinicella sp. ANB-PHB4]MDR5659678.1 carboxylate--amine ligase [Serpentinicella sp. ANB-PHB4]
MSHKAVVLGSNYYIGLSTIRCLGKEGVEVVAFDYSEDGSYGLKSKYCSEKLIGPHYRKESEALVKFLKDFASKQDKPPVLIPCADPYVEFLDKHIDELKESFLIPSIEKGLYTKLMNKETLHTVASEKGVAVPETVRIDEEDLFEKVDKVLKYPCIVKPVDSPAFVAKFRKKMFTVHNEKELQEALDRSKEAELEVIIQRIIPGFDDHMHTFDAFFNEESKCTHWMTCQKYRQYPINFGASVYTGQKHVQELYDIGAKFLEEVGYKGFAEIEFKKDADTGRYYLIEINVRITNLNSLLYKAGLNMPYIAYRELIGHPLDPKNIKKSNYVFWYAYEDLLAIKDYVKRGQLTLKEIIKSLAKPKAYAIWDIKDPMPTMAFLKILGGKLLRKIGIKGTK